MTQPLSQRSLNRATLARQFLLERQQASALDTVEHLAGMQSQAPLAPYLGLWARLRDFDPAELSALTQRRQVVRLNLMRNTGHLVSARDCLGWRPLFDALHAATLTTCFRRGIDGVDLRALPGQARELLAERPWTRAEFGPLLAARWPGADPESLAYAVTHHLALCQVPPRGLWGAAGPAAWTPVEDWLGAPLRSVGLPDLVRRYLGAFGPASVADLQQWSGLTRLGEVTEAMGLRVFRSESGTLLYDLPGAPRPDPDVLAPVRFLPEYDNLLLSHRDRTRVNPDGRPVPLPPGNGAASGTVLVDGYRQGTWQRRGQQVVIRPFTRLGPASADALLAEARRLADFAGLGPDPDLVLAGP
jgi:hypothetical protein